MRRRGGCQAREEMETEQPGSLQLLAQRLLSEECSPREGARPPGKELV